MKPSGYCLRETFCDLMWDLSPSLVWSCLMYVLLGGCIKTFSLFLFFVSKLDIESQAVTLSFPSVAGLTTMQAAGPECTKDFGTMGVSVKLVPEDGVLPSLSSVSRTEDVLRLQFCKKINSRKWITVFSSYSFNLWVETMNTILREFSSYQNKINRCACSRTWK